MAKRIANAETKLQWIMNVDAKDDALSAVENQREVKVMIEDIIYSIQWRDVLSGVSNYIVSRLLVRFCPCL